MMNCSDGMAAGLGENWVFAEMYLWYVVAPLTSQYALTFVTLNDIPHFHKQPLTFHWARWSLHFWLASSADRLFLWTRLQQFRTHIKRITMSCYCNCKIIKLHLPFNCLNWQPVFAFLDRIPMMIFFFSSSEIGAILRFLPIASQSS